MKIHVGVKPLLASKSKADAAEAEAWARAVGISHPRFRRGVLSGQIDPVDLERIRQRSDVAWVEVDTRKHILSDAQ